MRRCGVQAYITQGARVKVLLTPVVPEEAESIRGLMARTIVTSVTADEALRRQTIANVNGNVEYWLNCPERCVHLKATLFERAVGVHATRVSAESSAGFHGHEEVTMSSSRPIPEQAPILKHKAK